MKNIPLPLVVAFLLLLVALFFMRDQWKHSPGDRHHRRHGYAFMTLILIAILSLEYGVRFSGLELHYDAISGWVHLPIAVVTFLWLGAIGITGAFSAWLSKQGDDGMLYGAVSYIHFYITLNRAPFYALFASIVTGTIFILRSYPWQGY